LKRDRSTIENQVKKITDYCQNRGHTITRWFKDVGVSAVAKQRQAFIKMLETLDQEDGIICTYLDRFGRSVEEVILEYKRLQEREKYLIFTEMDIDTETMQGKLLFHILSAYAEFEREMIKERLAIGRELATKAGVKFGRQKKHIPKKELGKYLKAKIPLTAIGRIYGMHRDTVRARAIEYNLL